MSLSLLGAACAGVSSGELYWASGMSTGAAGAAEGAAGAAAVCGGVAVVEVCPGGEECISTWGFDCWPGWLTAGADAVPVSDGTGNETTIGFCVAQPIRARNARKARPQKTP